MRSRLLVLTLLATCLLAAAPAPADRRETTRCEFVDSSIQANDTARFLCEVRKVKTDQRITFMKGQQGCETYRAFYAESSARFSRYYTSDERSVPGRSFSLRDEERHSRTGELRKMRVSVSLNSKRLKFVNYSRFLVNVSFTMRCPFEQVVPRGMNGVALGRGQIAPRPDDGPPGLNGHAQ